MQVEDSEISGLKMILSVHLALESAPGGARLSSPVTFIILLDVVRDTSQLRLGLGWDAKWLLYVPWEYRTVTCTLRINQLVLWVG